MNRPQANEPHVNAAQPNEPQGEGRFCDRCGQPLPEPAEGDAHAACRAARELEPPRYCQACGRRTVVQVTPDGWSSRCSQHGLTLSRAG